ncbi:MAG: SH3 domain-containing protein [Bradyrhizobium sp.]|uniref:SH3 domain-containing protein n=1 Tax=Bradyrhizobium sp. TaxID=376 RepID=UPI00345BDCBE|nr:SH3 domain-containing protein [Bradyrhizobium sp.]
MNFGRKLLTLVLLTATAIAIPGALAQPGSAGGSIGNDEKSISGSRLDLPSTGPDRSSRRGDPANCTVADPTSTPLNVRTSPHGKIVGTVANGVRVRVLDEARDGRGEQWAYIADAASRPVGWVFKEYLACR